MPLWNNRAISGQPTAPYRDNEVMQGSDCWLELTFVDRTGKLAVPASVTYRIDNLTNNSVVLSDTSLGSLASTMEVNIPGALNVMTYNWWGSQLNQAKVTATFADGSTATQIFPYYVVSIATVGGA